MCSLVCQQGQDPPTLPTQRIVSSVPFFTLLVSPPSGLCPVLIARECLHAQGHAPISGALLNRDLVINVLKRKDRGRERDRVALPCQMIDITGTVSQG